MLDGLERRYGSYGLGRCGGREALRVRLAEAPGGIVLRAARRARARDRGRAAQARVAARSMAAPDTRHVVRRGARSLLAGRLVARRRARARRRRDRRAAPGPADHAARRHARRPRLASGDAAPRHRRVGLRLRRARRRLRARGGCRDRPAPRARAGPRPAGRARPGASATGSTRAGSGLALERVVVTAAGEVPLLTSLVSIASGRVAGPASSRPRPISKSSACSARSCAVRSRAASCTRSSLRSPSARICGSTAAR